MASSISGTGTLQLKADEACTLYVDGNQTAQLTAHERHELDLLPGTYHLTAENDLGLTWSETVEVNTSDKVQLSISFSEVDTPESDSVIIQPDGKDKTGAWPWSVIAIMLLGAGIGLYVSGIDSPEAAVDVVEQIAGSMSTDIVETTVNEPIDINFSLSEDEALRDVDILVSPEHGSLDLRTDSSGVTYTPASGFTGTDQFSYTLRTERTSDTTETTVQVSPVESVYAADDTDTTASGEPVVVPVLENDRAPDGDFPQVTEAGYPDAGTARLTKDSTAVRYTPADGYAGTDTFRYTVATETGDTAGAKVTLVVEKPPPTPADVDIEFTDIPNGSFQMGANQGPEEVQPLHRVEITTPFRISQHPVTVGQFRKFVEATGYVTDAEREGGAWRPGEREKTPGLTWREPGFDQEDDHPVVNVSWNDAQAFARWMGARLPTEAEWEYAARAGTSGLRLPKDLGETTWHAENTEGKPQPVGLKEPNEWGLYDVQGNVWEWVQDWYAPGYYDKSPRVNPSGPDSGELRVCRGGSWHEEEPALPARNRASPTYRATNIGFRIVASNNDPAS